MSEKLKRLLERASTLIQQHETVHKTNPLYKLPAPPNFQSMFYQFDVHLESGLDKLPSVLVKGGSGGVRVNRQPLFFSLDDIAIRQFQRLRSEVANSKNVHYEEMEADSIDEECDSNDSDDIFGDEPKKSQENNLSGKLIGADKKGKHIDFHINDEELFGQVAKEALKQHSLTGKRVQSSEPNQDMFLDDQDDRPSKASKHFISKQSGREELSNQAVRAVKYPFMPRKRVQADTEYDAELLGIQEDYLEVGTAEAEQRRILERQANFAQQEKIQQVSRQKLELQQKLGRVPIEEIPKRKGGEEGRRMKGNVDPAKNKTAHSRPQKNRDPI